MRRRAALILALVIGGASLTYSGQRVPQSDLTIRSLEKLEQSAFMHIAAGTLDRLEPPPQFLLHLFLQSPVEDHTIHPDWNPVIHI